MVSETGSDFPAAAALSLVVMAMCTTVIAVGELVAARHED
jgi:putative spermidine/putrescine transport system permease protein